jgi:hypothetical protein
VAAQKESVVTPERFEQGISWKEWMDQIDRNQDKFVYNYDETSVPKEDAEAIKALMSKPNGPAKCLALGEAWCTDVVRGLGPMAKLAEATGMELKIFFRDQNIDIMNEFLKNGEFQSIPTFVFYTKDHKYITHWIERPAKAQSEIGTQLTPIQEKMRNPELSEEERNKYMQEYTNFQKGPVWASWRDAQVREIRELLEKNVK